MRKKFSLILLLTFFTHAALAQNSLDTYFNDLGSGAVGESSSVDNMMGTVAQGSFNSSHNSGEVALVSLALIGTIVYVSWALYFPVLMVNGLVNKEETKAFQTFNLSSSLFGTDNSDETNAIHASEKRNGIMNGLNYNLYLRKKQSTGLLAAMGFAAEAGHYKLRDEFNQLSVAQDYYGAYLMGGPSILITFGMISNFYMNLDVMFGTSQRKEIGMMTKGQLYLNLLTDSNLLLGLGGGFVHVDTKATQGFVNHADQLAPMAGARVGFAF